MMMEDYVNLFYPTSSDWCSFRSRRWRRWRLLLYTTTHSFTFLKHLIWLKGPTVVWYRTIVNVCMVCKVWYASSSSLVESDLRRRTFSFLDGSRGLPASGRVSSRGAAASVNDGECCVKIGAYPKNSYVFHGRTKQTPQYLLLLGLTYLTTLP